jgi:predicted dehydrogenase
LCEKPLALHADEALAARERFARAGCHLEEAFMWRHHPQARWLREKLTTGGLGAVRRMHASFSFALDRPEDYRWSARMGGGALWDIGCYGVNAARFFFGGEPLAASFHASFTPGVDGVDDTAVGWLDFGGGRGATVSCSFTSAFAQAIEIVGEVGRAWVERPWLAIDVPARVVIERDNEPEVREFEPCNPYRAMIEHFTRVVREPSADRWPAEDGGEQARVMEGLLASARAGGAVTRYA